MREIKFRAWYKQSKRMRHTGWSDDLELGIDLNEDGMLMQYTGVKDSNGIEIYDGDILELKAFDSYMLNDEENIELDANRIVGFKEGSFTLEEINGTAWCNICMAELSLAKVIGNIYQNKELLS